VKEVRCDHGNRNSLSTTARSEVFHRPIRSFRSLRWFNGGVHWISAVVLVCAFISNGETNRAMMNPVAMRGEVKLGLIVGLIFLIRFIWVQSRRSGGVVGSNAPVQNQAHNRLGNLFWGGGFRRFGASDRIPGAELIPEARGLTTSSPALNAAVTGTHSFQTLWSGYAVFTLSTPYGTGS
jgi:hypothetical protein